MTLPSEPGCLLSLRLTELLTLDLHQRALYPIGSCLVLADNKRSGEGVVLGEGRGPGRCFFTAILEYSDSAGTTKRCGKREQT